MNDIELNNRLENSPSARRVTPQRLEDVIANEIYFEHSTLTICVLELSNGFFVTGESACADPANYDADVGKKIARDNAKNKIWALEGYLLKQSIAEGAR